MRPVTPGPAPDAPAVPRKSLLVLGALVLAIHLVLLQGAALQPRPSTPPISRPFITRIVPAAPALRPDVPRPAPRLRTARPPKPPSLLRGLPAPAVDKPPQAPSRDGRVSSAEPSAAPSDDPSSRPAAPAAAAPPADLPATPPAPAVAEALPLVSVPGSLRLKYNIQGQVRQLPYSASGELLWRHDGKTYEARLEVGAFLLGSRVQTSRGHIAAEGLAPTRFADKVRNEVAAHFERDKGTVIFSANTPAVALQPGAQDHLSIFMQLASLIGGEPQRYLKGSVLEMQAVGPRDAETWRFVVDGEERLQLPGGEQATLKLTRMPQRTYDLTVELWLAPALGYLPVRIRLTQNNGDFIDQQWRGSAPP